jgi:hypothetical protein
MICLSSYFYIEDFRFQLLPRLGPMAGPDSHDACARPQGLTVAGTEAANQSLEEQRRNETACRAECISLCRAAFLGRLSSSNQQVEDVDDFICSLLSQQDINRELWQLYWCDSRYCGVGIDDGGGLGQDRK